MSSLDVVVESSLVGETFTKISLSSGKITELEVQKTNKKSLDIYHIICGDQLLERKLR